MTSVICIATNVQRCNFQPLICKRGGVLSMQKTKAV